jgi:hypothetical protein
MNLAIRGLAGPLQNKVVHLTAALSLGRQGDIVVASPKVSSLHAHIRPSGDGKWLLEDNRSKNGTLVAGARIQIVQLTVGLIFYIGDQGFEVIEITKEPEAPPPTVPTVAAATKAQKLWHEVIGNFLGASLDRFTDRHSPVSPFNPAVVLDFQRGIQVNSRWILGYGPRKIGASSLDLPIWEPRAPDLCFELIPSSDGTVFQTAYPDLVRLNRTEIDSRILHVGDTIQIFETLIEVDFTE